MLRSSLILAVLAAIGTIGAEETRIWVPINEMEIRFKGEVADKFQGGNGEDSYHYSMMTPMGMMLTLFVEAPQKAGASNEDVCKFYWEKAAKNPAIDQATVKKGKQGLYPKVDYLMKAEIKGKEYSFAQTNIYFVAKGKWVDVHVSYNSPAPEVNQLNRLAFEKTFEVK
jgi:hypothetical protein